MQTNPVLQVPPATPADAADHFTRRLAFQTDVADVHAALESGTPGFTLVDARGDDAWAQAHIPGAVHLPTARMSERARDLLDPGTPVVTYCWGPGCDGAVRGALALARLGFQVKEMLGGVEYWIREGFRVTSPGGPVTHAPDPLTTPAHSVTCDC